LAGADEIVLALPHSVPAELNDTVDLDERLHLIQDNGESAITVMAVRDRYRWARDYPASPHPLLRWEPAAHVWVE
jgi:hypothetical protein